MNRCDGCGHYGRDVGKEVLWHLELGLLGLTIRKPGFTCAYCLSGFACEAADHRTGEKGPLSRVYGRDW